MRNIATLVVILVLLIFPASVQAVQTLTVCEGHPWAPDPLFLPMELHGNHPNFHEPLVNFSFRCTVYNPIGNPFFGGGSYRQTDVAVFVQRCDDARAVSSVDRGGQGGLARPSFVAIEEDFVPARSGEPTQSTHHPIVAPAKQARTGFVHRNGARWNRSHRV